MKTVNTNTKERGEQTMNTICEQISFITGAQKQDEKHTALRLRERLIADRGFEEFEDREILSTILSYSNNTRGLADLTERLLDTFGSLKGVIEARPEQLLRVDGMNPTRTSLIAMIVPITRVWHRCAMDLPDRISNTREAENYCMALLAGERLENFFVVALNAKCQILGKRRIST